MKEMGDKLSQGLKAWVDQGSCPPDVAARIESSLKAVSHRPAWRRWAAAIVPVAAAAAVLLVALSTQPHVAYQLASVPLLGPLAARLAEPDVELHLDPQQRMTAALFRPTRTVKLSETVEGGGLTLVVTSAATGDKVTRIAYTVRGEGLVLPDGREALMPTASTAAGPLTCRSLTADQRRDGIHFQLYCDAVPAGEEVTLTLPPLPKEDGGTFPALTATFTN
ncbi:hypothetical protein J2Z79_003457 [Symbiobacterium terraclitae]|uniref:DUF4179 domain-containing protein n=1 Tax=Symbiobacterium terraclitae TaxID=557451 RepID=A0ABS4JYF8_9FIRM|nr:hypothetical protein [Symbiobacterium terraclitae]MBP2020010.1 hypothetical protein [Symbiobacterium terraclitae]